MWQTFPKLQEEQLNCATGNIVNCTLFAKNMQNFFKTFRPQLKTFILRNRFDVI